MKCCTSLETVIASFSLQKVNIAYSLFMRHGQSHQSNVNILLNNKSILLFFQAIFQFNFQIIIPTVSNKMLALVSLKFIKFAEMNNIIVEEIQEATLFNFSSVTREGQKMSLIIHAHIHVRQGECDPGCILSHHIPLCCKFFQLISQNKIMHSTMYTGNIFFIVYKHMCICTVLWGFILFLA